MRRDLRAEWPCHVMRSRRCGNRRAQEEVEGPRPQLPITAMPALFENDVPPADLIISREFTERIRVFFFVSFFAAHGRWFRCLRSL